MCTNGFNTRRSSLGFIQSRNTIDECSWHLQCIFLGKFSPSTLAFASDSTLDRLPDCFQYFNDSMEIDIEILSSQFNFQNQTFPVNLVLQSEQSARQGFSSPGSNYIVANLPFDPTNGIHEYRIDFVPGNVIYYADGQILGTMNTSAVPTQPGHLILTQWSNGNPLWSYGPPAENATMIVSYLKAYFNSSDPERESALNQRCVPSAVGSYCLIPNSMPNAVTNSGLSYFFLNQPNTTNNQTIYQKNGHTTRSALSASFFTFFCLTVLVTVFL